MLIQLLFSLLLKKDQTFFCIIGEMTFVKEMEEILQQILRLA